MTSEEETMDVEFTDRYGGHAPSWLRACLGECEAMGVLPVFSARNIQRTKDGIYLTKDEPEGPLLTAWMRAEAKDHADDGWHFVECPDCGGTGRTSLLRTLARVPRWLWRGVGILRMPADPYRAPHTTTRQWWVLKMKAAYLNDLGLTHVP